MKRLVLLLFLAGSVLCSYSQVNINYYLPKDVPLDINIITPRAFTGHEVGEWHLTHDKLYYYMLRLAEDSERAVWEEYGRSHEGRPLGHLVISSPGNIEKLETIRSQHVALSDPSVSAGPDIKDMPVVIKLGYGVHGNESSAQNASMLVAYYLVAGQGKKMTELLDNAVILIDPCLNPDGFQRHSTWVNMYRSMNLNPDANSNEFREAWPGGRTNHYWFDLNRDYIMLQHPETIGRVAAFHRWKPNINTDHHEMGASSTFFFQPGVRTRENPHTPAENYELVTEIADYHIRALDEAGSLYYSEESFDDFYLGKGSAYPDIHASVGILFEQAGVKGHLREVPGGLISFPFAIRNQVTVSLSTLEAGLAMREKLLQHQVDFYKEAITLADDDNVKGYVFSDDNDPARAAHFIENLLRHQIKVFRLSGDIKLEGTTYKAGSAYVVPLQQPEYRYIRSMFEITKKFEDETFYDISTWTLPMSFNLPYTAYGASRSNDNIAGPQVFKAPFPEGSLRAARDAYAYVFEWNSYYSPAALYKLLDEGITVKVAGERFTYDDGSMVKEFSAGTIMIPAYGQVKGRENLYRLMKEIVAGYGIKVYGLSTGHTPSGIDLGSNSFRVLGKPSVLMYIGDGASSRDAGEIWHMLDTRFSMPVTMVNGNRNVDLDRYNVVILTGSGLSDDVISSLRQWVNKGGTLVALKSSNSFLARNEFIEIESVGQAEGNEQAQAAYGSRSANYSHNRIPGSIFRAKLDLSHPLCFGYSREYLPVFKTNESAYRPNSDRYNNPVRYSEEPLLSGFSSAENIERIAGSAYISIHREGNGKVISFYDNPNFRAIWFGTSKLFMNALFFGQAIR